MINVIMKNEDTIELDLEGEVTAQDYKDIRPKLEQIFSRVGKAKFLIDLNRVKNFTLGAVYQDIKFDLQHFKNIGTTAVVGSRKTYEMLTKLIDKTYPEKVEHFDNQMDAMNWLQAN